MQYASVRILGLPYNADKSYEYHIPLQLEERVHPGSIVLVPFGGANKMQTALVQSVSGIKICKRDVKPIAAVPGKYLDVKKELLDLCLYMSEKMLCSVGDAVKCVLPAGLGVQKVKQYTLNSEKINEIPPEFQNSAAMKIVDHLKVCREASALRLEAVFGKSVISTINKLVRCGILREEDGYECKVPSKTEKHVALNNDAEIIEQLKNGKIKLTSKQLDVYEYLMQSEGAVPVSEVIQMADLASDSAVVSMLKKQVIVLKKVEIDRSEGVLTEFEGNAYGDFELSEEQQKAYDTLYELYKDTDAKAALLRGVTGSGKTNVILKLIDEVIASGKAVIVLVPEIALTSQTVGRFTARYKKDGIALIHSGLSAGERIDSYKKITDGEAKIVIGTRSAVFAPVDNLGLIVMDEEHESSFKSDKSPKYHARDVARFRCAYNNALLLMASATPCIESYYRAKSGRYTLVEMKKRYGGSELPDVEFYDMKNEPYFVMPDDKFDPFEVENEDFYEGPAPAKSESEDPEGNGAVPLVIGKKLESELENCLERGEQAIIFINRRGYRAFALCRSCGSAFTCPHCSVSMTYHKGKRGQKGRMVCHYCGTTAEIPDTCPQCGQKRISFVGSGTQLLEETLNKRFPRARVLRMDADTTAGKFGHEKILKEFRNGNADILVGTQMVAKGHDFPGVSLVGVALADTSLFVNDFRANEKTFSLITQVLGRAGRSKKQGRAVLQTYVPDNDVLGLAACQDYEAFYEREIAFRKANVFPPFCDIVTLGFTSEVEMDLVNAVKIFGKDLDELAKSKYPELKFILYGPFQNEIYRIAGKYRMRFIIKCRNTARMREMLSELVKKYIAAFKNVTISADINPTNL